jgi:DNA primase large subunit
MQVSYNSFTLIDLAKYPFLKGTAERVREIDLRIENLLSADISIILERAEQRVREAILNLRIRTPYERIRNPDTEIYSYPIALLLVAATDNSYIRKRYALAEAKQASLDLAGEPKEKILRVAENFGWLISLPSRENPPFQSDFVIDFTDYLRNTTHLSTEENWKLVNRVLIEGKVFLNQADIVRLLEEEIGRHIHKRVEMTELPRLPDPILEMAGRLKQLAIEKIGTSETGPFPSVVIPEAFPPCITALYQAASKNQHLPHIGRFTLTAFLVNVGMSPEKLTELFKSFSDYNERLTRYQVEHIAGVRGSGTRYTPPNCETLQTHGVCTRRAESCKRAKNPLICYKRNINSKPD